MSIRLNRGLSDVTKQIHAHAALDCLFNQPGTWFYLWSSQTVGRKDERPFCTLSDLRHEYFIKALLISTRLISSSFHYGGAFCNAQYEPISVTVSTNLSYAIGFMMKLFAPSL